MSKFSKRQEELCRIEIIEKLKTHGYVYPPKITVGNLLLKQLKDKLYKEIQIKRYDRRRNHKRNSVDS